jgi:hypothetical protein
VLSVISFACDSCFQEYTVPLDKAGKHTKCRTCGAKLVVPDPKTKDLPQSKVRQPHKGDVQAPYLLGGFVISILFGFLAIFVSELFWPASIAIFIVVVAYFFWLDIKDIKTPPAASVAKSKPEAVLATRESGFARSTILWLSGSALLVAALCVYLSLLSKDESNRRMEDARWNFAVALDNMTGGHQAGPKGVVEADRTPVYVLAGLGVLVLGLGIVCSAIESNTKRSPSPPTQSTHTAP